MGWLAVAKMRWHLSRNLIEFLNEASGPAKQERTVTIKACGGGVLRVLASSRGC